MREVVEYKIVEEVVESSQSTDVVELNESTNIVELSKAGWHPSYRALLFVSTTIVITILFLTYLNPGFNPVEQDYLYPTKDHLYPT